MSGPKRTIKVFIASIPAKMRRFARMKITVFRSKHAKQIYAVLGIVVTLFGAITIITGWSSIPDIFTTSKPGPRINEKDIEQIANRILDKFQAKGRESVNPSQQSFDRTEEDARLREQLGDALARVARAAAEGDAQAQAAIDEARRTGNTDKFQIVLIALADHRERELKSSGADYLAMCREIALLAYVRGDIEESRKRIEIILQSAPDDCDARFLLGRIHLLQGRLEQAEQNITRVAALSSNDPDWQAAACGALGIIYENRGDLGRAEEMHRKALSLNEKLGRLEGVAIAYGNLGIIFEIRGDLERAEGMHRKALTIEEKLGRLGGMAADYGNLGIIYRTRGDLGRAEEMHRKALAIHEKFGRLEGMAIQYGNLGVIYQAHGDLDRATEMLRKALAIDEKLGSLKGMSADYCNLGRIYLTRGDFDRAEEMHRKSLKIEEELGRLEGMAVDYGNLGVICRARGNLDRAEEMHRKALSLNEKLGRLEGVADSNGNLGSLFNQRGDKPKAREFWTQSRDLYAKIGMPHMVAKVQAWLDELPPDKP